MTTGSPIMIKARASAKVRRGTIGIAACTAASDACRVAASSSRASSSSKTACSLSASWSRAVRSVISSSSASSSAPLAAATSAAATPRSKARYAARSERGPYPGSAESVSATPSCSHARGEREMREMAVSAAPPPSSHSLSSEAVAIGCVAKQPRRTTLQPQPARATHAAQLGGPRHQTAAVAVAVVTLASHSPAAWSASSPAASVAAKRKRTSSGSASAPGSGWLKLASVTITRSTPSRTTCSTNGPSVPARESASRYPGSTWSTL